METNLDLLARNEKTVPVLLQMPYKEAEVGKRSFEDYLFELWDLNTD